MVEKLIGGYERTGVYLSADDFAELKQVIKKAHVKDAVAKRAGIGVTGGSSRIQQPTLGSIGIETFMKELVKAYGFNDSDSVQYGANNKGEICRWLSPGDVTKRTKKGG